MKDDEKRDPKKDIITIHPDVMNQLEIDRNFNSIVQLLIAFAIIASVIFPIIIPYLSTNKIGILLFFILLITPFLKLTIIIYRMARGNTFKKDSYKKEISFAISFFIFWILFSFLIILKFIG